MKPYRLDLHFQTQTTIDTLDYSGDGINQGSIVVMAAAGDSCRKLSSELGKEFLLPDSWKKPKIVSPGSRAKRSIRSRRPPANFH